ncbi:MAG: hypothetical protein HC866_17555 [Leptolyngbyaceae cyanobacterium RU_5_1]|nr:hypothetical protein [Leptolyngbyaceae cyanobacterium RU_5_1]
MFDKLFLAIIITLLLGILSNGGMFRTTQLSAGSQADNTPAQRISLQSGQQPASWQKSAR